MNYKKVNGLNIFYRVGTSDEFVITDVFDNCIFENGFPEYKIKKNHLIIDVGAHIGAYSLKLSQHLSEGVIHAFEPCLETFNYLQKNITTNNINNIIIHKIALSDNIGKTKLYYDIENGNWGHSIVKSFSTAGEIVETDTLTNFFSKKAIKICDYIKFNCEGAEFKIILSSSVSTLKKIKNMLILYHLDLTNEYTIEQLVYRLKEAGFYTEIRQKSDNGKRGWLVAMQLSYTKKFTFVCKQNTTQLKSKLRLLYHRIKH